jgi:hypothetical protein
VSCSANDCAVQCTGENSCFQAVSCSATSCSVECENCSCRSGVFCSASRSQCDRGGVALCL